MSYLYAGTILFIDLSQGRISKEPTSSYSRDFLGGRGINIRLLYDNMSPGTDPLDPASFIVFGVGPLGGTAVSSGRTEITAKSPESGILGLSNFGGYFGGELKFAGYDHIVITGRADKPVYLWIDNERVEIRDASGVWGKDTYETPNMIRLELGNPEVKVVCIGPAGENLVRFASVQSELGNGAGRNGMGTVMGSKNLKAIAVRGTKGLKLANPQEYLTIAGELEQALRANPGCQEMAQYGVSRIQDWQVAAVLGEDSSKGVPISQHAIFKKYKPKRAGCFGCPIQCMELYNVDGIGSGVISCEFYGVFAPQLRCADPALSLESALWTQRYGIDCVSVGMIIEWLMQLYEKGVITAKDTDGIPMVWGTREAIRGMLDKIVYRQGIGDTLAEGILPAARKIGRGSEEYVNQVKGVPMVEGWSPETLPSFKGMALANAVCPRGDSMTGRPGAITISMEEAPFQFDSKTAEKAIEVYRQRAKKIAGTEKAAMRQEYEGKPALVAYFEDISALCDSLSTCKYISPWNALPFSPRYQAALLSAGSGVETSVDTLFEFAKRIRTLERTYDVGEGLTRDADSLPKQFMDKPIEQGKFKGEVLESDKFEEMKSQYYARRGWDADTGIPTKETLKELGLGDVARDLAKRGKLPAELPKGQGKTEQ